MEQTWVIASGTCAGGDHELVEVFIGDGEEVGRRVAELAAERDDVADYDLTATEVPLRRAGDEL